MVFERKLQYWREWAEAQPEYQHIATPAGRKKVNERWRRIPDSENLPKVRETVRESMPEFASLEWLHPRDEYDEALTIYQAIFRLRIMTNLRG